MASQTNWIINAFSVIVVLLLIFITYFKWSFKYWHKRHLPYTEPAGPLGSLRSPFKETDNIQKLSVRQYNEFKSNGYKHAGFYLFSKPIYMPINPEYIKNILIKDFQHFVNRGTYFNEKDDPLNAHLFNLEGAKWKNLRTKLTPTFTSGKMKIMFHILLECGNQMKEVMDKMASNNEAVDIKDILARFTIDVIGSTAFGLDCNSLKNPESDFTKYGKRVFSRTKFDILKSAMAFSFPGLARSLRIVSNSKDTTAFYMKTVKETVEYRERNNFRRNDFMQILIDLKNKQYLENVTENEYQHDCKPLTFDELAAQAFVFFIAGFETSSTTMTFCLLELALNPDIQQKTREEVITVLNKYEGNITYDAITKMKYMKQVIDETLRKYPPVQVLNRQCTKTYHVPDTTVRIDKGTLVLVPVLALHYDPEYYPYPEKFDPERFGEGNQIHNCTYLPFGKGHRNCIGLRFGIMQTKVGLMVLLKNFRISLNKKTSTPIKISPLTFIPSIEGGLWLNLEKI